jgi:hypothetical protein
MMCFMRRQDSSHVDLVNDRIHLYGGAKVEFQKIKLSANYMVIDFANNLIEGFHTKGQYQSEDKS